MQENLGPEILAGILDLYKQAEEATWAMKRHDLPKGKWRRVVDPDEGAEAPFVIL